MRLLWLLLLRLLFISAVAFALAFALALLFAPALAFALAFALALALAFARACAFDQLQLYRDTPDFSLALVSALARWCFRFLLLRLTCIVR